MTTAKDFSQASAESDEMVSRVWVQVTALVLLCGLAVLGFLGYRAYAADPPIAAQVRTSSGTVVFTGADVTAGQQLFLRKGLMEYGSIFGHGAYLGPDFTADYLHRAAQIVTREYGGDASSTARDRVVADFRTNRYDPTTGTVTYSDAQAKAFDELVTYYAGYFGAGSAANGLLPEAITDPAEVKQLTSYFAWSAWAGSTQRPDKHYSYTNNWPPEKLVGNVVTADVVVWSVLSLIVLLAGIGALFAAFGRWGERLGWRGRQADSISFRRPGDVAVTPTQRACAYFFLVVGLLFVIQTLVGAASEHYRADLTGFFGFDLGRWLPYNLVRTWHVQLAIFWTATSFLATGLFLAPIVSGREPRRQSWLAYGLLGALALVVFGSLIGEGLDIHGWLSPALHMFGMQGWEYLDLGRVWQVLLTLGLFLWAFMLFRGLRGALRTRSRITLPWLFFFTGLAIPAFYAVGLLTSAESSYTVADFWRFMVVHLWVEDFLEIFTTVLVAYLFVMLGVIRQRVAMTIIYLDVILYSIGGVVGTMHHLYFSGTPAETMALGAFFSAAEVLPLTFLTVEAWSFLQLGSRQEQSSVTRFPHRWAVMFLVAVGFWNFLGAGIFGFLVNLPVVSYYEIGTALTANHAHAAMMGVYGMLAIGLALFCLRYLIAEQRWPDRLAKLSFWSCNIGLAWMCFATLLPLGVAQLYKSVDDGYFAARQLEFVTNPSNSLLEWMRLPGDVVFIVGGALPVLWICWLGVRYRKRDQVLREPEDVLFTEISEPRTGVGGGR
ncbi:nitric-oxide reductase large subunit [Actinoplanes awajinensis]|uniref:Nitric oxide reductase n=1 Tax=Actinoplanes awajinensis subsp. mycoplanecinus TaxID=135947 RepID=A0A0X3VA67_9ACTN|nr:cbb3-type cytochrome c oxidase subunit I [Actinoplanes awajinensis]KUL41691.1 nitric oxide reductase [Actinoplanes awajinensis subsp. mycoplanecinus]